MSSLLQRNIKATLLLPGIVAGLAPAIIVLVDPWRAETMQAWRFSGVLPLALGFGLIGWSIWHFASRGRGTLAPWDPPARLVTGGPYRVTRNPMYVAVPLIIFGIALLAASPCTGAYGALIIAVFHARITLFEEPALLARFGEEFVRYRARVPRWIGRVSSLRSDDPPSPSA